tara:strand:- start:3951 stop:4103 length:153 start_codon:yes stop_codon:yes gene_type:complete
MNPNTPAITDAKITFQGLMSWILLFTELDFTLVAVLLLVWDGVGDSTFGL